MNDGGSNPNSQLVVALFNAEESGLEGAAGSGMDLNLTVVHITSENDNSGKPTDQSMEAGRSGDLSRPDRSRMTDQVSVITPHDEHSMPAPIVEGEPLPLSNSDEPSTPADPDQSRTTDQVAVTTPLDEHSTPAPMVVGEPLPLANSDEPSTSADPDHSQTTDRISVTTPHDEPSAPAPMVEDKSSQLENSDEASTSADHGHEESPVDPMDIDLALETTDKGPNTPRGEDGDDTSALTTPTETTDPSIGPNDEHLPLTEDNENEVQAESSDMDVDPLPSTRKSARLEKLMLEHGTPADPISAKGSSSSSKTKRKRKKGPSSTPVQKPAAKKFNRSPPATQNSARKVIDLTGPSDLGSKSDPIDVDLFSVTSSWEPDNLGAFVSRFNIFSLELC